MSIASTRRQFLQTATAGVLALGGMPRGARGATGWKPKYVLASSLYGTLPLADVVAEAPRCDCRWIDLWPKVHADHREQAAALGDDKFAELLAAHDVRLGMTTRYDLGPHGLESEFAYLQRFGARLVVTGSARVRGATTKEAVQAFVDSLQGTLAAAEKHGVTVAIENHGGQLLNSLDAVRWFADAARSPHLGLALAPAHLPQDAEILSRLIDDLGPKLVHFYAWQTGDGFLTKLPKEDELKQLPGRGPLDFGPLLAALRRGHYDGWIEIFMHPTPRGVPILESAADVTAAVRTSGTYLEQRLAAVE